MRTGLLLFWCLLSVLADDHGVRAKGKMNFVPMDDKVQERGTHLHLMAKRQLSNCNFMYFLEPPTAFTCSPSLLNVTCRFYIPSTPGPRVSLIWQYGPTQSDLSAIATEFTGITNAVYESTLSVSERVDV